MADVPSFSGFCPYICIEITNEVQTQVSGGIRNISVKHPYIIFLPRARLDGVLAALGLPPTPSGVPMPLAATGLRATPSPPLAWVEALSRLLRQPSMIPLSREARATLVEGLRGAALYGTASAFSERGFDVLAKTGTSNQTAGGTLGVVVAAWPAAAPTRAMVLVAAGVAGKDAADLAAAVVATSPTGA